MYADYYAINPDLFSFNINSTVGLTKSIDSWTELDKANMNRVFEGMYSVLLSLRKVPMIRYLNNSEGCTWLADQLTVD